MKPRQRCNHVESVDGHRNPALPTCGQEAFAASDIDLFEHDWGRVDSDHSSSSRLCNRYSHSTGADRELDDRPVGLARKTHVEINIVGHAPRTRVVLMREPLVPAHGPSRRTALPSPDHARLGMVDIIDSAEVLMTDILIRDVPDDVVAAIDAKAARMGLSRAEYLRRTLERERTPSPGPVTPSHLQRLSSLAADLDDPDVMSRAWT